MVFTIFVIISFLLVQNTFASWPFVTEEDFKYLSESNKEKVDKVFSNFENKLSKMDINERKATIEKIEEWIKVIIERNTLSENARPIACYLWYLLDNELTRLKAAENMKLIFDDVDFDTFNFYDWDIRSITEFDKNNVYFFPVNWETSKLKMNVNNIQKISNSKYFYDGEDLFFDRGVDWIEKLDILIENLDETQYLWMDLLVVKDVLFYKWINQAELWIKIDEIKINEDDYYFITNDRLFFANYSELTEIEWVDLDSFKKVDGNSYEDKNYTYEIVSEHYGFHIEKKEK